MKDKQHTNITIGMKSPLSPGYGALAFDPFSDDDTAFYTDDMNNNNNYDYNGNDGHTYYNPNDYSCNASTFPRRSAAYRSMPRKLSSSTSFSRDADAKARLPVFKLLHVNRRKAELIALMPDGIIISRV